MSKVYCLFLLSILFLLMKGSHLVPDQNSPISISYPSAGKTGDQGTVIKITFTLPPPLTFSSGLSQENSLGIYYHQYIGVAFLIQESPVPMFTDSTHFQCKGKVTKSNLNIIDLMLSSQVGSTNRHIVYCRMEDFKTQILPGDKVELFIHFLRRIPGFVQNGTKAISLSTSSSMNDDKYIYTLNPVYSTFSIHPISIQNIGEIIWDTNREFHIDANVKFEATIKFLSWYNLADYTLVLIYDPKYFINQGNNQITITTTTSTNPPEVTTTTLSSLNFDFNGNYHSIGGYFDSAKFSTSDFIIKFEGFKSASFHFDNCFAQIAIYYKNTNNVVFQNNVTFKIIKPELTVKVNENNHDYFKSGAFPIKFSFIPKELITDFYLVIRQKNFAVEKKVTFIASTCDLLGLGLPASSQLLTERPYCFPLDYDYPNSPTITSRNNGSGFFVYLKGSLVPVPIPNPTNLQPQSLTVWAYFDECGPRNSHLNEQFDISFEVLLYKSIDATQYGVKRFNDETKIGQYDCSSPISCYNTDSGNLDQNGYHWDEGSSNYWGDKLLYREYYNWDLLNWVPGVNLSNLAPIYLLELNNVKVSICLRVKENFEGHFLNTFPLRTNMFNASDAKEKIEIKYTQELVQTHFSECIASWTFSDTNNWIKQEQNWISGDLSTCGSNFIQSKANAQISFGTPQEANQTSQNIYFGLFDNCHQFVDNFKVTSLYQPFEVQVGVFKDKVGGQKQFTKLMRMVKLFSEGGIFNSMSSTGPHPLFTNHFGYQKKDNMYGVCLIELNSNILSHHGLGISFNSIAIWVFLGSLIETDYQTASLYPVSNLHSSSKSYGLPSQHSLGNNNFFSIGSTKALRFKSPISFLMEQKYSSYHFFMGSLLLFSLKQPNPELYLDSSKPLLIPYYCPIFLAESLTTDFDYNKQFPTVTGAFVQRSEAEEIWYKLVRLMENNSNYIFKSVSKRLSFINQPLFTPVRFSENKIEVKFGNCHDNNSCPGSCTAHITMLDDLLFETQLVELASDQYILPKGKYLYPYGKAFSGFILMKGDHDYSTTPLYPITNKIQISLDKFYKNNKLSSIDKVGYWCPSSKDDNSILATNFLNNRLLADYANEPRLITLAAQALTQISGNHANSFSFQLELPSISSSIDSFLSFTLDKTASICGINSDKEDILTDCIKKENYIHYCQIKKPSIVIYGSCYNVNCNDFNPKEISMSKIIVTSPNDSYHPDDVLLNFVTIEDLTAKSALLVGDNSITSMTLKQYSDDTYAHNNGALGKMFFELDLKRDLPRNANIVISSPNFNKLRLTDIKPKCVLSFRKQYPFVYPVLDANNIASENDLRIERALFNSCVIDFSPISNTLTFSTKNIAFKYNFTMRKIVYIHIWPAVLYNLEGSPYTIDAKVGSLDMNSQGRTGTFERISPEPSNVYETLNTANKLCYLTGLSVLVPGEKSDYTFALLLSHAYIQEKLANVVINEVTIYFSHDHYQGIEDNILCYEGNIRLVCFYSSEGVLNIQWTRSINNGKDHDVTISCIRNPILPVAAQLNFAYSFNKYSLGENKTRYVLLYGTGNMREKTNFSQIANGGVLRFFKLFNSSQTISESDARSTVNHTFRVFIDFTAQATKPTYITEPLFVIEFPEQYQLYAPLSIPKVTFDDYILNGGGNLEKAPSKEMKLIVSIKGNRLFIRFNQTLNLLLNNIYISFWQITVMGLTLPQNANLNNNGYNGAYHIMAINHDSTIYYSTPMNANNYSTHLKGSNSSFRYEQWYKGDKLNYGSGSNPKWYIDIISSHSGVNRLAIQPGRYFKASFMVIENTISLSAMTDVVLDDPIFKTMEDTYKVITSLNEPQDFYIGCPCDTMLGNYFISFNLSNMEDFAIINQIKVNVYVDKKAVSKISYTVPTTIPTSSSFWLKYYLEEPNFEELIINWRNKENNFVTISIPPKTFTDKTKGYSNTNSLFVIENDAVTPIKYTVTNPNNCYEFEKGKQFFEVEIDTAIQNGKIPNNFDLKTYMKFILPPVNNLPKNSVQFTYIPKVIEMPSFLYCLFQCSELPIPPSEDIVFKNQDEFMAKYKEQTPFIKYYSVFIPYETPPSPPNPPSFPTPIDFIFNDLIRGLNYKLICVLEAADNKMNRKLVVGMMTDFTDSSTVKPLIPKPIGQSYCSTIKFTQDIDETMKIELINLCQQRFSRDGYSNQGCIICSEIAQMTINKGMESPQNKCEITSRLRLLTPLVRNTQQFVSSDSKMLTICIQQDERCPSDPTGDVGQNLIDYITLIDHIKYPIDTSFTSTLSHDITITPSDLFGELISWNSKDSVTFNAFYQGPNILACYYIIIKAYELVPSIEEMESCALSGGLCGGVVVVGSFTKQLNREVTGLSFINGIKYNMYLGCRNSNPRSQHTITIPLGSFTAEYEEQTCPDGTMFNYPDCLISSFLSLSYLSLFIIMILV